MEIVPLFVGIDVAKHHLDVALSAEGPVQTMPNDPESISILVRDLAQRNCALIVLEATGGYEAAVAIAIAAAGLPVVVANPRQTRDFARATGQLGKTDTIDARGLALFGERVRPPVRSLQGDEARLLDALLTRRRQLIGMLTAEKNRLGFAPKPLHKGINKHIRCSSASFAKPTKTSTTRFRRAPSGGS